MRARSYAAILAVIALATAGAFLLSDDGSGYADAADASGTDANIDWTLAGGVLTLTLSDAGGTDMGPYATSTDAPWYAYRADIARVVVGAGITSIGGNAFYNCYALSSISIPGTVTSIGDSAFRNCYALSSISIPSGVTSIGTYAFMYCRALASVTIPDGVTEIAASTFAYSPSIQEVVIPASVQTIGASAFLGCRALRNIVFEGDSALNLVGANAFKLADIEELGGYISQVKAYVWSSSYVYGLVSDISATTTTKTTLVHETSTYDPRNPSLPGSDYGDESGANSGVHWTYTASTGTLKFTGTGEIAWATSTWHDLRPYVKNVTISGTDGLVNSITIGDKAFYDCSTLASVTFVSKVTAIGDNAFYGCFSLRGITIPDTVTTIGNYAFRDCRTLASIVIPASVTSIGNSAFYRSYSLKTVEIQGAADIGTYAFHGSSLTSVAFSGNLKSIGAYAFNQCYGLRSIVIPASVTSVDANAFRNCYGLTSAAILAPGLALPATVFDGDSVLTAISIYNPGAPGSGTRYDVAGAANPGAIAVYYDNSVGGPVYAKQSPSKGSVALSGFPATGAARVGTSWIGAGDIQPGVGGYVLTVLDGGSFPVSKLGGARTVYASLGFYHVVSASMSNGEIAPSGDVGVVGGVIRVAEHGDATLEFAANAGYALRSVEIDGDSGSIEALAALAAGTHTFEGAISDHAISVTSAPSASSPGGAGSGSGSGSGSGNGGDGSDDAAGGPRSGNGEGGGVSVAWILILIAIAIAVGSFVLWLVLGRRRREPAD
ncbi:MAG: leucine-rich repeat domain-containing protein [Candidatus Methanoplasma sp.]|jgi:hypothetical protein|nr:leucine-rich repeat domain-containing protein [Candidatus Methanoplasma sp.]